MNIGHRLGKLEARLRPAEAPVTWDVFWAAQQREDKRGLRFEIALLTGAPLPQEDVAEEAADRATIARWRQQRGITPDPLPTEAELVHLEAQYLRVVERVDTRADGTRITYLDKLRCLEAGRSW